MHKIVETKIPPSNASQIKSAKLLGTLNAGVAKLVDARDLKFLQDIVFV